MPNHHIGEFEQMVLLALLQCSAEPYALEVRRVLEERADRPVSRGALYRTFDRLADKKYLEGVGFRAAPEWWPVAFHPCQAAPFP